MNSERSLDKRAMGVLAAGHMMVDMTQGALPAMLPFLISEHGYSYAAASALVLAATIAGSIVQPLFGFYSDRRSLAWLMPVGVLSGVVGIALVGVLDSYAAAFASIVLGGLGVAAYHPEGLRFANYVSGEKRASGMSLFGVGGNIGFALGPAFVTPLVLLFGLPGTLFLIIPGALVALVLVLELPRLESFRPAAAGDGESGAAEPLPEDWSAFGRLSLVIVARTFIYFGLLTFVPLYFVEELGTSEGAGNTALTVLLVGGAIGTLIGGPMADRVGRRTVLIVPLTVLPFLILAFHASPPVLATVVGFFVGALTVSTVSPTIVMGHEYLPGRIGVASGVTLGLAIGLGGLGATALGLVADRWGLDAVINVVTVLPLLALALAFTLPKGEDPRKRAAAAETFA